jgi:hypothetical protein
MITKHCILFCPHCETYTVHYISRMKDYYACQCGNIVEIDVIEEEIENV